MQKKTNTRPQIRSLKIQQQIRLNKYSATQIPEIKLKGNWLEKLGFIPNQRVCITTMKKLLIISVVEL